MSARIRARSSSYANGRPMTSSAPRSSARTRSTRSEDGREHDDGNVPVPGSSRLATPKPQAQLELGEENDVGPRALGELERLAPAGRAEHVEAVVAELPAEVLARLGLGLGDEDGARHADDASPLACPAPDVLCGGSPTSASSAVGSEHGRPLQPTVTHDAPDQPQAEGARDDETRPPRRGGAPARAALPSRRRR